MPVLTPLTLANVYRCLAGKLEHAGATKDAATHGWFAGEPADNPPAVVMFLPHSCEADAAWHAHTILVAWSGQPV